MPKYLAWVGPRRADIVFPISATLTALARTLLSLFIFFSKSCDEEKNVDDNDDEKKPWGTTSHPHSRRSKERATKGLFLQPLWRRIYCRSQTEKRQNDPFCTFCSLQMATQVVWKCIPRQCKSKKLHFSATEMKKILLLFSSFWSASINTQQQESEDISVFFSACHRQKPLHLGKASEKCN